MKRNKLAVACALALGVSGASYGQSTAPTSAEVEQLKAEMAEMQKQVAAMKQQLERQGAAPRTGETVTAAPAAQTEQKTAPGGETTAQQSPLSTRIGGTDVTLYGHVDVSADNVDNGKERISQVSSNLSYLGVRGSHNLGSADLKATFQIETLANVSNTPTETSGLASRNSFVGLASKRAGALMFGKFDTPYKRATAAMDPFSVTIADYNSIMGNTGGDLRAEFDPRLPHAVFWDSPQWSGFSLNALYSPHQKLSDLTNADNYAFPQGEPVCSGASPRGSGSTSGATNVCDDGAFKNAWSVALNYDAGPLLVTAAYERHSATNRTSDTGGVTADESAAKAGASLHTGPNRFSAIIEKFYRNGGIDPSVNERARNGYYLSDVLEIGYGNELMAAWAHAGKTPGGPDFMTVDDKANMYALGARHRFDKQTNVYFVGVLLRNGEGAHYALGPSGHGVPVASPRDDNGNTIPGKTIKGVSVGAEYNF